MIGKNEIKTFLKELQQARKKRFEYQAKLRSAEIKNFQKRNRVANRTLNSIFEKGLKVSRIDKQKLEKLHLKDDKSAEKFRKNHLKEVKKYAVQLARNKKRKIQKVHNLLKKRFKEKIGNPRSVVYLTRADAINVFPYPWGDANINHLGITKSEYDNRVEFLAGAGSAYNSGGIFINICFDFVCDCPISGTAEASCWLFLDGFYSLKAYGKCIGHREAYCKIGADIWLQQYSGAIEIASFPVIYNILDEDVRAGCSSKSNSGELDRDFHSIWKPNIPVVGNLPSIVSVNLSIALVSDEDAFAYFNALWHTDLGLNVPIAMVIIEH